MAFEDHAGEGGMERTNYFGLECGEVVFLDEEIDGAANCVLDELDALWDEGVELTDEAIRGTHAFQHLSEYEKPSVLAAIKIQYGDLSQLEEIPHIDSHESYQLMQDFIETVNDDAKRDRLSHPFYFGRT